MIVAVVGTTDRMAEPSVCCCTMVNEAVTELPVVRSVARICAGCVGAFTAACNIDASDSVDVRDDRERRYQRLRRVAALNRERARDDVES